MAYIQVVSTTETSIRVRMSGLDTSYEFSDRTCSWYLNGRYSGQSTLGAKVSSGGAYTFTGLQPGTDYTISVTIDGTHMDSPRDFEITASTDEASVPNVALWDWWSSNGSATASQTRMAYNAVTGQGYLSNFSYLVWNDMVDKVDEILSAKGLRWDSEFASYSATRMSSGDRQLTARRFNSLRYNIGSHYSTGINTVYSGDTVYGWYFTRLTDCMNGWI